MRDSSTRALCQCGISGIGASVTRNGNRLTVSVPVTFNVPVFAGAKNVYLYADDTSNFSSGWKTLGVWTVR